MLALVCFSTALLAQSNPRKDGQPPKQVVARVRLSSPQNKERPVFAEAGDVLSALKIGEKTILVQSAAGRRANVRTQDVVALRRSKPVYDRLIKAQPKNATLYVSRAMVHSLLGERPEVIADLNAAIRLGDKSPSVWINRGVAYAGQGEFDKAIADYGKAIALGYDQPNVFMNRAVAYLSKGEMQPAADDFTRVLAKQPDDPFALMQRGIARQRLQQWDAAIADFSALVKMDDKNMQAISARGFTHYLAGDSKAAVEDFTRVIELSPDSALAYNNRGYNRQVLGDYAAAIADFNKAIELAPDAPLAYQNKAWLLATCPDEKIRDGKSAIAAAAKAGELRDWKSIPDVKSLAAAYAEVGDFDKAVQWQQKAAQMAEGDAKSGEEELLKLYKAHAPFRFAPPAPEK